MQHYKGMKRVLFALFAGIALVGCNKDNTGSTSDTINQQKDAVNSAAKDAKKQVDANADAAKAQLDADKKKAEAAAAAATNAATTNK
jgi:hypothetical protein